MSDSHWRKTARDAIDRPHAGLSRDIAAPRRRHGHTSRHRPHGSRGRSGVRAHGLRGGAGRNHSRADRGECSAAARPLASHAEQEEEAVLCFKICPAHAIPAPHHQVRGTRQKRKSIQMVRKKVVGEAGLEPAKA